MIEYLFIRPCFINKTSYIWFSYDYESDNILATGEATDLKELAKAYQYMVDRPVIILFPSSSLSFRHITTQKKIRKNRLSSILYLLEDDYIDDAEDLNIKLLKQEKSEVYSVIYKKDLISKLENELIDLGFKISFTLPDSFALPVNEEESSLYVMKFGDEWVLRTAKYEGIAVNDDLLAMYLDQVRSSDNKRINFLNEIPPFFNQNSNNELHESPYQVLVHNALNSTVRLTDYGIDDIRNKKSVNATFRPWLKVVVALLVLVILASINLYVKNKETLATIKSHKESQIFVIKQTLGTRVTPKTAKENFTNRIDTIERADFEWTYVNISQQINKILASFKDLEIDNMNFDRDNGTYDILFSCSNNATVEKLKAELSELLSVHQVKIQKRSDSVNYTWQLSRKEDE